MRTARLARHYVEEDEAPSSDMKGERMWTQGEGVFYLGQVLLRPKFYLDQVLLRPGST